MNSESLSRGASAQARLRSTSAAVSAQHLWVLTGSVGAIDALRGFLGLLPENLPVAFVLSLHIADSGVPMLLNVLARSTRLRVTPACSNHVPRTGEIMVAPVGETLSFGPRGELEIAALGSGQNLVVSTADAIMAAVARRFRGNSGAIVFSGIGSEGAQGCRQIIQYQGRVWVQDPVSAPFSSMPGFVMNSCEVEFCATPEQMARRFVEEFGSTQITKVAP